MPRSVTVTFADGTSHTYDGVPDTATPKDVNARAAGEFKKEVTGVEAAGTAAPEPTKRQQLEAAFKAKREGNPGALDTFKIAKPDEKAYDPNEGFLSRTGRKLYNAPGAAAKFYDAAIGLPFQGAAALAHPVKTGKAIMSTVDSAADILAGGVNRNFGDNKRDNTAYNDFAQSNFDKYGDTNKIDHAITADPFLPAVLAVQATRGGVGLLPNAVKAPVRAAVGTIPKPRLPAAVTDYMKAKPASIADAATMAGETSDAFKLAQAKAASEAARARVAAARTQATGTAQETKAARAARISERLTARKEQLKTRQARVEAGATPGPLEIAPVRHPGEWGDEARAAAVARQIEIETAMRSEYAAHKAATEAISNDLRDKGIGVSDGPKAQALIKETADRVDPKLIDRKEVSSVLDPAAGGAAHKKVLDVLSDTQHVIQADEVNAFKAKGFKPKKDADGNWYVVTKPDLEAIENLRRDIGQRAYGQEVEGFKAVSQEHARELYDKLNDVVDEYTGGAHAGMRDAWREGKDRLTNYEKIKSGRDLVGVQPGTSISSVPSANIPQRVTAGGRDTIAQAKSVAGDDPINNIVRAHAQNEISGITSSAKLEEKLRGTKLGEVVSTDPSLEAAVQARIAELRNAEAHGVRAGELGAHVKVTEGRQAAVDKIAAELNKASGKSATDAGKLTTTAEKAAQRATDYETRLADLEHVATTAPEKVGPMYVQMLKDARQDGLSLEKYEEGLKLAARAGTHFENRAKIHKMLTGAAYTAGGAALAVPVGMHGLGLLPTILMGGAGVGAAHVGRGLLKRRKH